MGHPLRWFLPGVVYEATIRTIQERFLLRPSPAARAIILGVLGRAQWLYPGVRLYAFAYLSNHAHLLVSADDGQELAAFLGYVNSNVAREMGRLHDWRGPFWGRRHRPIPILDDDALIARLRYIVAHGIKEGLVASPTPGRARPPCPGLLGDMELEGIWYDRNLETRARRRGAEPDPEAFAHRYRVLLSPIPPWADRSPNELRALHRDLVTSIEAEHQRRSAAFLGVDAVQTEDPHARPESSKRRAAPSCHTTRAALRTRFRAALRAFVTAYRAAAAHLTTMCSTRMRRRFLPAPFHRDSATCRPPQVRRPGSRGAPCPVVGRVTR